MIAPRRSWLFVLSVPLLVSGAATATPEHAYVRCSRPELPSGPTSLFFTGRATAVMRDAPVRGAGERMEALFNGSSPAQLFDVQRIGGTDAAQVSSGASQVLVVPWGYGADCSPQQWSKTPWVEAGTSGFVYGQLRAREHWVDGIPTIDTHNPYQLPYPRYPARAIAPDDAFTMVSLLPHPTELQTLGPTALAPLAAWVRERPDLAAKEPGRQLRSLLTGIAYRDLRAHEPEIAGTYRFTLDLGDGRTRTFFARTESHATSMHRPETGDAFIAELRPPRIDGYSLIIAPARAEDALPTSRGVGGYGYMYVDLVPERLPDGTRRWQAGAELSLLKYAFPVDVAVQAIVRIQSPEMRQFLDHNVPPGSDAWFRMSPDGRVTFEQRFRLPGGGTALLRGVRTSTVAMPTPR